MITVKVGPIHELPFMHELQSTESETLRLTQLWKDFLRAILPWK